jgi:hypothetical protein
MMKMTGATVTIKTTTIILVAERKTIKFSFICLFSSCGHRERKKMTNKYTMDASSMKP